MMTVELSICIAAPIGKVWALLADLESFASWAPGIRAARCTPGREHGAGAERVCDLAGGLTITERWIEWSEGVSFTYEGTGLPGVKVARNTWSVEPYGARTLLTSRASVELRARRLTSCLELMMRRQSLRMGRRSLVNFKHLVEHGELPQAWQRVAFAPGC